MWHTQQPLDRNRRSISTYNLWEVSLWSQLVRVVPIPNRQLQDGEGVASSAEARHEVWGGRLHMPQGYVTLAKYTTTMKHC